MHCRARAERKSGCDERRTDPASTEWFVRRVMDGLPAGGGTQNMSGSNQIAGEPRCYSASLQAGQFLVAAGAKTCHQLSVSELKVRADHAVKLNC